MTPSEAGSASTTPSRYATRASRASPGRSGSSPATEREESHEELTWDEFFEIAERDDQVVVYHGEEVGMVVGAEGDVLYVDPHPSITDRIRSALGWGGADEDDYTVGPEQIAAITDDRVELASVEREMEDETSYDEDERTR